MTEIVPIKVPKWGLSMEEGTISDWHISEGDQIAEGDDLVDIETTKITNVFEATSGGTVRRIVAESGVTLPVGALLAVMADANVSDEDIDAFIAEFESNFDPAEAAGDDAGLEISNTDLGDGRSLRVGTSGADLDGTPMVFIHGFGGDVENWSLVLEALAGTRPTYAVELPGHGQSTKQVGGGTLDDLASAVVAALSSLDLGKMVLVGHSLGGAVATEVASRLGDQIAGLALVCPAAMPGGALNSGFLDAFVDARRARDLKKPMQALFKDPEMVTRDMLEDIIKQKRLDGAQDALRAIKDGLDGGDAAYASVAAKLNDMTMPRLLLASRTDQIVGVPDLTQLPDSLDVEWLEDVDHMPQIEIPGQIADLLKSRLPT